MSDDPFAPTPYEEMMLWAQQHGLHVYSVDLEDGARAMYLSALGPAQFDVECQRAWPRKKKRRR
jgi:hypothetical protein